MADRIPKPRHSDGALFKNNDKDPNDPNDMTPDYRGHLDIQPDQLQMLHEMYNRGLAMKLEVGAWVRRSKAGAMYMSLDGETYLKDAASQRPPRQQARPAPQLPEDDFPF